MNGTSSESGCQTRRQSSVFRRFHRAHRCAWRAVAASSPCAAPRTVVMERRRDARAVCGTSRHVRSHSSSAERGRENKRERHQGMLTALRMCLF